MLLQNGINQESQAPNDAGVVSVPTSAPRPTQAAPEKQLVGPLLEADDKEAFRAIRDLVKRQEMLARNRFQLDKHFTAAKMGYTGSYLIKVENQDQYQQAWLPGSGKLQSADVPNKQAELCQRLTETLLVDPPKLEPEAEDDDETAQRGAELAKEYLEQDAGEAGTDDLTLFAEQIEGATTRASTFNHYWIDPQGGGSSPKQIKAHPQATDPANPFEAVGPDGQPIPTTDYILRYVTEAGQFTVNPSEAERVWLPRQRVDKLGREHVRLYPETADLHHAQQAIVLFYCTVAEAKRRWPETVGQMDDAALTSVVGWTPDRPLALLPPMLRSKWREGWSEASKGDKLTAIDQRLMFYYGYYGLADSEYPEGAVLCVNGANGGLILGKDTLSATVEIPSEVEQDQTVTDTKDLDLPLVQIRLLADTDERDPMGTAFMRRIAGGGAAMSYMAASMQEAIDIVLHPVRYSIGTSSAEAEDVEESRSTGRFVHVNTMDEVPKLEERRDLPGAYFNQVAWLGDQLDASAGLRPPDSANEAKVKSGVALRIEVQEATKTLTRMNYAVHAAWARHGRIKLQMAMKHFGVPQLLSYVGVDGAAKQEWFTGNNFARVGSVTIKSGTGTMLPWSEKVNLALQLAGAQVISADEANDIARGASSKHLGATPNPHVQRIERQVSSWLEGPPPEWEQQQAAYVQAVQAHAMTAQVELGEGEQPIPTEPPPTPPWTPFAPEVMDTEPPIAAIRKRRLSDLMAKVEFSKFGEPWKQLVRDAYLQAAQVAAQAQMMAQTPQGGPGAPAPQQGIQPGVAA